MRYVVVVSCADRFVPPTWDVEADSDLDAIRRARELADREQVTIERLLDADGREVNHERA